MARDKDKEQKDKRSSGGAKSVAEIKKEILDDVERDEKPQVVALRKLRSQVEADQVFGKAEALALLDVLIGDDFREGDDEPVADPPPTGDGEKAPKADPDSDANVGESGEKTETETEK